MKKILRYIAFLSAGFLLTTSCRDDNAVRFPSLQNGVNARLIIDTNHSFYSLGDIANTYVGFDIYSVNTDIDKIVYSAKYNDVSAPTDAYPLTAILTVPGSSIKNGKVTGLKISAVDLATAFNLAGGAAYLGGGDSFAFSAKVTMKDGRVIDASTSAPSIANGTNSSFTSKFTLAVACPSFVVADAIGTYNITVDELEVAEHTQVEIVAGPGDNQITLKDLFGHPEQFDVIVTVDPVTSAATVAKQDAWDSGEVPLPYGIAKVAGTGTFFSCAGFLTLSLESTVDAGSFGFNKLELQKAN